jgi:hypothetical protein
MHTLGGSFTTCQVSLPLHFMVLLWPASPKRTGYFFFSCFLFFLYIFASRNHEIFVTLNGKNLNYNKIVMINVSLSLTFFFVSYQTSLYGIKFGYK